MGLIRRLIYGMMYGDLIMNVANQVRPYEVSAGDTTAKVEFWTSELLNRFDRGEGMSRKKMRGIFEEICADFKSIPVTGEEKVRVGVVGEIYVKYSPLGNNNLEDFLRSEDCEPVVPGLTDFILFKCDNRVEDHKIYGGKTATYIGAGFLKKYVRRLQDDMIAAIGRHPEFRKPCTFDRPAESDTEQAPAAIK